MACRVLGSRFCIRNRLAVFDAGYVEECVQTGDTLKVTLGKFFIPHPKLKEGKSWKVLSFLDFAEGCESDLSVFPLGPVHSKRLRNWKIKQRRTLTEIPSVWQILKSINLSIDNNSKINLEPQYASFGLTGLDNLFRVLLMKIALNHFSSEREWYRFTQWKDNRY